jgi:hypothetical protein
VSDPAGLFNNEIYFSAKVMWVLFAAFMLSFNAYLLYEKLTKVKTWPRKSSRDNIVSTKKSE